MSASVELFLPNMHGCQSRLFTARKMGKLNLNGHTQETTHSIMYFKILQAILEAYSWITWQLVP